MAQNTAHVFTTSYSTPQSQDFLQTFKMPLAAQVVTPTINPSNESALQRENELLQDQIKKLSQLLVQYQFTNQKVLETLHENIMLHDNVTTLDLKIGCLSQAVEIQSLEICRRDNMISEYSKDLSSHKKRVGILSKVYEKKGSPICEACLRHSPILTKCKNHSDKEQIVGCVFCCSKKCPECKSKDIEHVSVQLSSKKIKKMPKTKEEGKLNKKD